MKPNEVRELLRTEGVRVVKGPFGEIKATTAFLSYGCTDLILCFEGIKNSYLTVTFDLIESFEVIPDKDNKPFNLKSFYGGEVTVYATNEQTAEYLKDLYFDE